MKRYKVSFLFALALVVFFAEARKDSSEKMIEYHGSVGIDEKAQQVFEQFANAADTIITISAHPKDKRLIIKKVAQMLADITKFVVEATRKVCLVDELSEEDLRGIAIDNAIEIERLEDALIEEELFKKDQEELLKAWCRMTRLIASLGR